MKYKELTNKSEADLRKELASMQVKVQELRMKNKLGQVKNHQEMSAVKKDIARILTFLRAKI
jgi:large subunit ribosomal protein L29